MLTKALIALASMLAFPAFAQPPPIAPESSHADVVQAKAYIEASGIPADPILTSELRRVLATDAQSALRHEFSDRLAALHVDDYPEGGMIVRLTGSTPVPARTIDTAAGPLFVHFIAGAPATIVQRRQQIAAARPLLFDTIPGLHDVWFNELSGMITLDIISPGDRAPVSDSQVSASRVNAMAREQAQRRAEEIFHQPVVIVQGPMEGAHLMEKAVPSRP